MANNCTSKSFLTAVTGGETKTSRSRRLRRWETLGFSGRVTTPHLKPTCDLLRSSGNNHNVPADDIDDLDLLVWFGQPPERRALDALEHIMMNLADMPRWACAASPLQHSTLTFPVYIACVESYFTNARLAAEFFWKMPRADITARSFVPDWEAPPGIAKRPVENAFYIGT